jgi:hypothetical protein
MRHDNEARRVDSSLYAPLLSAHWVELLMQVMTLPSN